MTEDYRPEEYEEEYEPESWERFMTEKEYLSLKPWGRRVAEYWTEFLPNMCREMKAAGELMPELRKQGERLADYEEELVRSGLALDGVSELVWERVHAYQPEPDNLRMDEEELEEMLDREMRYQYLMDNYQPEEITSYAQYKTRPEYRAWAKQMLEWYLTPEEEQLVSELEDYRIMRKEEEYEQYLDEQEAEEMTED